MVVMGGNGKLRSLLHFYFVIKIGNTNQLT